VLKIAPNTLHFPRSSWKYFGHLAVLCLLIWSTLPAAGQAGNLKVWVTFPDGRPCNVAAHVQLMSSAGLSVAAETYTSEHGEAELYNVAAGTYHLVVSGQGIETADSGVFEIDPRKSSQSVYVTVTRTPDENQPSATGGGATVSAADLHIPENAAKEFDKATPLMAQHEWKKAIDHLNRAVVIYPQYAAAWNNLGAAYARLGDSAHEREALEKAVSLNDHFAAAFVNLAKLAISDRDLGRAEGLLDKAAASEPTNAQTLILLANVELLQQHYDAAIANCSKVHTLGAEKHALVHYIAGRALEHENRLPEAVTEFQAFLKEEPDGDRANAVRSEVFSLQEHLRAQENHSP